MSQRFSQARLVFWFLGEPESASQQQNFLFFGLNDNDQAFVWVLWSKEQIKALTHQLAIDGDHLDQLNEQMRRCRRMTGTSSIPAIEISGIAARAFFEFNGRCQVSPSGASQILIPPAGMVCGWLPPSVDTTGQIRPVNATLAYIDPDNTAHVYVFSCIQHARNHLWSMGWITHQWREDQLREFFARPGIIPWSSDSKPIHVTGFAARILCGIVCTPHLIPRQPAIFFPHVQGDA